MAPSHMEHETDSLEYTHKKFNCGYSHKKLGMRLIRRNSQDEELQQDQEMQTDVQTTETSASLFRPYALDVSTDNQAHPQQMSSPQEATPAHMTTSEFSQQEISAYHYYTQYYSQQQSADAYALKLQRQRAALYMKHVMQFYENGNGWPSVHPNALNTGMHYNTHQS